MTECPPLSEADVIAAVRRNDRGACVLAQARKLRNTLTEVTSCPPLNPFQLTALGQLPDMRDAFAVHDIIHTRTEHPMSSRCHFALLDLFLHGSAPSSRAAAQRPAAS